MEVPSKLQKVDRGAKRGCFQLAEEVRRENSYTGNARKPTGGSKCSAAVGENEFNFSSRSTNLEHEYYSPTFLPPMHNANGPELHALPITGNSENQIVRVPDKIDATEFPFDNRHKDTDLQSTRIVDRNKDRKGKQVSSSLYDRLCEKNMRSEVQSAGRDRKCPSSPSQKPLDNSKSGRIDATEFPFDNRDKDTSLQSTRIVDRKKDRNKIDATKFPFDNQYKDTDLQSTRIVDRNKDRKGTNLPADTFSHNLRLRENQHLRTSPGVQKTPLNGPARNIIWKGNFEIHDCPSNVGFCEGVVAHSSAKVSRDGNLHLLMYSQGQCFPNMFNMRRPARDDIALYFYPGNNEKIR